MKTTEWISSDDRGDGKPIPHSGGEGKQLKGYNASNRKCSSPSGGTCTAQILSRPGRHVPMEKPETMNADYDGTVMKSRPEAPAEPKKWWDKDYDLVAPATMEEGERYYELSKHDMPRTKAGKQAKMKKVMGEYKRGELRSGSKTGPRVKSRAQAVAIGLSQSGQSKY